MKPSPISRAFGADTLSINSDNVHCYYSTVQSEVHPQDLVDTALTRRHARALELHRRRRARPARVAWIAALLLAGLCMAAWGWLMR
ncbi:hypothetical protein [Hydrogenophaga sp. PAMC20947]|uniref:hypothetical protein n=1 Tax=Hydrogenophaga sp. PAMC20947 TaxID=2565558 RepID=UPI00109D9B9E|nr:hypothetical protein [Hydrogenophaga sp. PAMC20947]QCB47939.1 hypothetical protein E5678_19015 [Hydrogenophaga sp. PAMC20947]